MTSLPKTMAKFGNKIYIIRKVLMRTIKNGLFIEFELLCQKLWALYSILALFTMPAHQIWSCYVTQDANFENFLFCPNSTFNIRKSHKIQWKSFLFQKLSAKDLTGGGGGGRGWKTPPSAFRINHQIKVK